MTLIKCNYFWLFLIRKLFLPFSQMRRRVEVLDVLSYYLLDNLQINNSSLQKLLKWFSYDFQFVYMSVQLLEYFVFAGEITGCNISFMDNLPYF